MGLSAFEAGKLGAEGARALQGDRIKSTAPATGELLGDVPVTSPDEVRRVVAAARKAQRAWAVLPVQERAQRVLRLRDALSERTDELVDLLSRESGKPRHEALLHEVMTLLDLTAWAAEHVAAIIAPGSKALHLLKHRTGEVHHVPRGVIGVISPWNFPLVIPMGTVVEALLTGNACVVKPSEVTPLILAKVKEILRLDGPPRGPLRGRLRPRAGGPGAHRGGHRLLRLHRRRRDRAKGRRRVRR